jgi:hypothetical protein
MVLQAFMDESEDPGETFLLAGHIATARTWENFTPEWKAMLPYSGVQKMGSRIFI